MHGNDAGGVEIVATTSERAVPRSGIACTEVQEVKCWIIRDAVPGRPASAVLPLIPRPGFRGASDVLVLETARRIADNAADLKQGVWNKKEYSKAKGLYGRTLGLIGVGGIGREMVPRARAFGMPVVAWSRSLTTAAAQALGIARKSDPLEVAR